jgi:FkbM family methyltransferase
MENYFNNRVIPKHPWVTKRDLLDKGVVLYGCGVVGQYICDTLREVGINADWFVDRNVNLAGTQYHSLPIRGVDSLSESKGRYVLLCSTHIQDMIQTCARYGISDWILAAATRQWLWLNDVGITSQLDYVPQSVYDGFRLLADDKSRRIYDMNCQWNYIYNNDFNSVRDPVMYFPDDLAQVVDYSHFCDVGAWYGDVLSDWVAKFADKDEYQYTAIEPDKKSYQKLLNYVNTLPIQNRIATINCAVSEKSGIIKMSADAMGRGTGRVLRDDENGVVNVPVFSIDELFGDKAVSIIKADVEGHEMPLLHGALQTIKNQRPALAISTYHRFADMWKLPQWVESLDLDYDLYLRHFPKVFTDTVMFAVPRRK